MGIGTSIFLFAVGAILRFAVTVTAQGVDLHVVGNILMLVGILGMILSLVFWGSWGGFGGGTRRSRETYVDRSSVVDPGARRTVVEREDVY